jgi:hypothetical protein
MKEHGMSEDFKDEQFPYITILDVAKARLGRSPEDRSPLTGADFARVDLAILGGCAWCSETLAAYNAYPTRVGFWSCADCLGDDGFESVEAFEAFVKPQAVDDLLAEAERALEELVDWNAQMGSFDAPAWRLAHEVRHKLSQFRNR